MTLQRKAFDYLKQKIGEKATRHNFKIYFNTSDVRIVSFDCGSYGSIEYRKTPYMTFFWTNWACKIHIEGMTSTESEVDQTVIDDIIRWRDHIEYEENQKRSASALESFLNKELGE